MKRATGVSMQGHRQMWSVGKKWRNWLHFFHCSSLLGKALRQDFIARSQQLYLGYLAQGLEQNDPLWLHPASPPCPTKHQSAEGTHRLEVGWHRAHKSGRCHRGRDACLAQLGCRAAVLKSTALGNGWAMLRGEDFVYWGGWSGKAKSLVNEIPRPHFCKSLSYLEEVAS